MALRRGMVTLFGAFFLQNSPYSTGNHLQKPRAFFTNAPRRMPLFGNTQASNPPGERTAYMPEKNIVKQYQQRIKGRKIRCKIGLQEIKV